MNDLTPEMLAELERLREENTELKKLFEALTPNPAKDFPVFSVYSETAEGSQEIFCELTRDAVQVFVEMLEMALKDSEAG